MATAWTLLKNTANEWLDDRAPALGAALAFYSMLSIGPLLLITLSITSLLFGHDAAQGRILYQIDQLIGPEGARAVQDLLASNVGAKEQSLWMTVVGAVTLLIGASGVFGQLQEAFNIIWNVKAPKHGSFSRFLKRRFLSFSMVLGVGFLLLISLLVSAALAGLGEFSARLMPGMETLWQVINQLVSLGIVTLLFAALFKYIPDTPITWNDVWVGGAITALLFTVGKLAIGLYLGHSALSSTYGAAGSLVVILVWVYYSAQILFFGAEFTQVYAKDRAA